MLKITIPGKEFYDEQKEEFVYYGDTTLQLEHSLVSISKWEGKWCKPFLSSNDKSVEEIIDYIKCMTITQNVKSETYERLTEQNLKDINSYIHAPMTATTFRDAGGRSSGEIITSEIIYYWMIALQIPSEYQKWHLNRLLTLIRVCDVKNTPPKKMSRKDVAGKYASLNAARRAKMNSKG